MNYTLFLIMKIIITKLVRCNGKTLFHVSILKPCIRWSNGMSRFTFIILIGTLPMLLWKGNDKVTIRRGRNEAGQIANPQERSWQHVTIWRGHSLVCLFSGRTSGRESNALYFVFWYGRSMTGRGSLKFLLTYHHVLTSNAIQYYIKLVVFLTLN